MDNKFYKPHISQIYGVPDQKRYFVYSRETLKQEPIFPYYVLDGGAFFFMTDHFGDATSETLLKKTLSGELFDLLRDKNGEIDWGISYHTTEGTGLAKRHEWQSWPQRLYMLLPLAQEYMKTGEKKYAAEWMRILRLWSDASPYEPFHPEIPHINTSMKWRDMQVGWRTMTLMHSVFLLGTEGGDALSCEEWNFVYHLIELSLDHLVLECENAIACNRYGNHVLQMGSVLTSAGILFSEFPNAEEYTAEGRKTVRYCHENAIFADGGSNESSPSYSHFIARLYLEAEKHCELNDYPEIPGLHESIIRQYQWLATTALRCGKNLRTSDSYSLDAHADIRRMSKVVPFTPSFEKKSVWMRNSGFVMLRNDRFEVALDAMSFFGGHQHCGRLQPLLWINGEEVLADTGCYSYDFWDFYAWTMTAEAHSVVCCTAFPERDYEQKIEVIDFNAEHNRVTAKITAKYENLSYEWTRTLTLNDCALEIDDHVSASQQLAFCGRWYLGKHSVDLEGTQVARQLLKGGILELSSTMPFQLDRTPALNDCNQCSWLERLTWRHTEKDFSVHTKFEFQNR